jgi:lipopolysaccharide transport system ATP-binding protein
MGGARTDGRAAGEPTCAIAVSKVWKKFRLYQEHSHSLKERVIFWRRRPGDEFWALKDVTLEVPRGQTLGLIGANGSGKSTLLKVISRILYPDCGEVKVHGRVSTLLELGAGFHPDFTGRENIFLNASILGLGRRETRERLGDIIAFSELGGFIDNPIRSYSSGMYMRLGFSVAVHADPDVLLVDEVLAVGDLSFQRKCLERIRELQRRGTTIVLVTHVPEQVLTYCHQAAWLDRGQLRFVGPAADVVGMYTDHALTTSKEGLARGSG